MNRREKRRDKKVYSSKTTATDSEISGMIKIFVGVVIVFLVFYFAYAIYNGELFKGKEKEDENTPAEFQDAEILAGSSFGIERDNYMVLYYDFDSEYAGMLNVLRNGYAGSTDAIKLYAVDLSVGFNKPYISDSEEGLNRKPASADELKVVNYTLIRFQNGKVIEFITDPLNIKEYINSIIISE